MKNKTEYLIDMIFKKLKNNNFKKINLKKEELTKFINLLINNS